MIPRNLIQFWHDPETLPEVLADAMTQTISCHRDYQIIQANDVFMHQFIRQKYGPAMLSMYQLNNIPSSRSDIARLMLLYEYGGVYIDASLEFHASFSKLHGDTADIVLAQRDDMPRYEKCPEKAHVINGLIAVPAKSDFIKFCLQDIIHYFISGKLNHHVNIATGPDIINSVLRKHEYKFNVKKLSIKSLKKDFISIKSAPGFSNRWPTLQRDGIIDPEFYKRNGRHFEKSWVLKNKFFNFSFSMLSTK